MSAFTPIRPTSLRLPCPAMPTTSVANNSGATIVRIRRMKIVLRILSSVAAAGKNKPNTPPTTIAIRIQVVSDGRRIGNPKSQDPNSKSQEVPNGQNCKPSFERDNRGPGDLASGMLLYGASTP